MHRAPIQFGHNTNATAPRLGNVVSVYSDQDGGSLYADIEENDALAAAVDSGYYPDVSIGAKQHPVRGALADNSELYTADFGATKTHTVAKPWNNSTITLADIIKDCMAMGDKARGNSFGNALTVLTNSDVLNLVIAQILKLPTNILNLSVTDNAISFPGFTMRRLASTYYDYKAKQEIPVIPNGKVCAIATDAPHWLPYCAIDDIDAQLAPLPFFSKAVKVENPSAWEIYGKSKPFPVPIVDAICWADIQ